MAGLEHFELGEDVDIANRDCHRLEVRRRIDENVAAHVHAAHVQAADVGDKLKNMLDALRRQFEVGGRARFERIVGARREARARPGGEIDQNIGAA